MHVCTSLDVPMDVPYCAILTCAPLPGTLRAHVVLVRQAGYDNCYQPNRERTTCIQGCRRPCVHRATHHQEALFLGVTKNTAC